MDELARAARMRANPDAGRVYSQLLEDFDPALLGWVLATRWSGPVSVPIGQFDMGRREGWRAQREPDRVDSFAADIARGRPTKPIVAVKEPGRDGLVVVDGHHRLLAYEQAGEDPVAWVGYVDSAGGPWEKIHDRQRATVTDQSLGA
jgi:hypothetical protein